MGEEEKFEVKTRVILITNHNNKESIPDSEMEGVEHYHITIDSDTKVVDIHL